MRWILFMWCISASLKEFFDCIKIEWMEVGNKCFWRRRTVCEGRRQMRCEPLHRHYLIDQNEWMFPPASVGCWSLYIISGLVLLPELRLLAWEMWSLQSERLRGKSYRLQGPRVLKLRTHKNMADALFNGNPNTEDLHSPTDPPVYFVSISGCNPIQLRR